MIVMKKATKEMIIDNYSREETFPGTFRNREKNGDGFSFQII